MHRAVLDLVQPVRREPEFWPVPDLRQPEAQGRQRRQSLANHHPVALAQPSLRVAAGRPQPFVSTQALLRSEGCANRKSTRLKSSHVKISYDVFCLNKK